MIIINNISEIVNTYLQHIQKALEHIINVENKTFIRFILECVVAIYSLYISFNITRWKCFKGKKVWTFKNIRYLEKKVFLLFWHNRLITQQNEYIKYV